MIGFFSCLFLSVFMRDFFFMVMLWVFEVVIWYVSFIFVLEELYVI